MCAQCMMGALAAGAGATGARSWLATRRWSWLTARRLRLATVVLLGTAVIVAGALFSGAS